MTDIYRSDETERTDASLQCHDMILLNPSDVTCRVEGSTSISASSRTHMTRVVRLEDAQGSKGMVRLLLLQPSKYIVLSPLLTL